MRHEQYNHLWINHGMGCDSVLLSAWMGFIPWSKLSLFISLALTFHTWKLWIDYKTCIERFANFPSYFSRLPTHCWYQMVVVIETGSQATTGHLEDKHRSAYQKFSMADLRKASECRDCWFLLPPCTWLMTCMGGSHAPSSAWRVRLLQWPTCQTRAKLKGKNVFWGVAIKAGEM